MKGIYVPKGYKKPSQEDVIRRELNPVKIIIVTGDLKQAKTADGITVKRQNAIYVNEQYGTVKCADYDNHFIFRDPLYEKKIGRSMLMCTCGSIGVVIGAKDYANNASPTTKDDSTHAGQMIVCLLHQKYNKHGDGSS